MRNIDATFMFNYAGTMLSIYRANKGEGLVQHSHTYPHATYCAAGKTAVRKDGVYLELTSTSQPINLVADEWHELEALEDGTVFVNVFDSAQLK